MKIRKLLILLAAIAIALPVQEADAQVFGRKKRQAKAQAEAAAAIPPKKKETSYEKLFKGDVTTSTSDFITIHRVKDKLYFEIPLKYFEREMLLASTLTETSYPDFGDVGYKAKAPLHIKFTRADSVVHMRQVNAGVTTDKLQKAVGRVYQDPIMYSYDVKAWKPDSSAVVIDITPLFTTNIKQFDFFPEGMMGGLVKINSSFKKEASYLEDFKAFEDNLSVRSVMSYSVGMGVLTMKLLEDYPFTAKVTRSILLLPENKMQPRVSDSRVGIFNTGKQRISMDEDRIKSYSVAHRWRLEPKDPEAYSRGELTEPVKQIVFYVDDSFPELWKEPIRNAVTRWNDAFERIGFKNVMVARDFPTPEEDPAFDPDNLKYSCIRYLPVPTANAMGPSWVDPTTGEIINASVIVYSDVIQMINNWRFVQTSQLDERVRSKKMPNDIITESLEYVVAHEVGHCLGFMHNMASSAAFPVDSLRSATFTQQFGTTPCIMDYARFNYVAQPGDKGVRMTPPELGVYDYFLIDWNYRYVPGMSSEWEEKPIVESWVDAHAGDPLYRYGRQQVSSRYDPSAIEEDLGDDPRMAGDYGIKNLKYILSNLEDWISDDPDYSHRQALYSAILNQYYRYTRNVMYNIGGIYLTEIKEGTPGERHVPVPKTEQKASLRWVLNEFKNMGWIDDPSLKKHFRLGVDGSYTVRDRVMKDMKGLMSNVVLSSHYSASPYTVEEFTNDLYNATWENILQGRRLTEGDKILQKAMVEMFCEPFAEKSAAGRNPLLGFAPSVSEIVAYGLDETGFIGRFASVFEQYDIENGHGATAMLLGMNSFGSPGMGFQPSVNVSAIDDSNAYLQSLAIRSRTLLRNYIGNTSGSARAHYQSLLIKLNNALKDKI